MIKKSFLFLLLCASFILNAKEGGTVVCLHGFLANSKSMTKIEKSMRCIGLRTLNWEYHSTNCTFEEHARRLSCCLQQIAKDFPGEPINFVAHSSGALIVRAVLNMPECPKEAKDGRCALLAPPNKGSKFAKRFKDNFFAKSFVGTKSGCQLMNYDENDIQKCFGCFPENMQVLVISGTCGNSMWFCETNDGFITLSETELETPFYWVSFPVNHGDLLTSPDVLCCLRTFIYWGYPEEDKEETTKEMINE